jgi:purine-nucleoside phosphorylase
MLYIVTALKPEAQAFVDKYKLTKSKLHNFTLFQNKNIRLIISGLGITNARLATQTLINHFDITDEDIYLNVGICAASKEYNVGNLIQIGSVFYEDIPYTFDTTKEHIVCLDIESCNTKHKIADMESYGFYDAVIHNPAIKNFHILKVVSDHFEPNTVTKEKTKSLIFHAINNIQKIIQKDFS